MAVTFNASTSSGLVTTADNSGQIAFQSNGTQFNPTLISGTSQASTSGTSIDFTSIPSWVKRITVMFNGVSTSGTSSVQVQLGTSSGVETTGYTTSLFYVTGTNTCGFSSYTSGFVISGSTAANTRSGLLIFANINGNIWVCSGNTLRTDDGISGATQGSKSLGGTLDRVRITTVNGTDTFDAGSINILYE